MEVTMQRFIVVVEEEADAVGRCDRLYLETITQKAEEAIRAGGTVSFEHHPEEEEPIVVREIRTIEDVEHWRKDWETRLENLPR
jgi:hypothetical protein